MATPEKQITTAAFIHSRLDDLPLSLTEFRVYCHMARRAGEARLYYESVPNCAKFCRIKIETARKAFQTLCALGLIQLVRASMGKTWTYRISVIEEWNTNPTPQSDGVAIKDGGAQSDGVAIKDRTPSVSDTHTPPLRGATKVFPEGNPFKGDKPPAEMENWQLEKDINRLREMVRSEADKTKPNEQVLSHWRERLKALRAEVSKRSSLKN